MAEDEAQVLAKAKKLGWEDRLAHKNWKVRSEAYEDIKAACESAMSATDPVLDEFGPLFGKAVVDANAPAQDKALDALIVYLEKVDEGSSGRIAHDVGKGLTLKCMGGRPGTVKKATDVFLLLVELGQANAVVESLIAGANGKVPKAALGSLLAIHECVKLFGAKVVTPQPILKAMPAFFESRDAKMRTAVKDLTVEFVRWVGADVVRSVLMEKMRDAMKKDVEEMLSDIPSGKPKAERFTRKEQKARAKKEADAAKAASMPSEFPEGEAPPASAGAGPSAAVADDDEDDGGVDAYEFAPEVEVLSQLKSAWWSKVEAAKWSERRDALIELKSLTNTPRLAPGDYGDVMRLLKKLIGKDSNVVVVGEAIQCAGNLSKGLRKDFSQSSRILFPLLVEKTKDKNAGVLRSIDETLGHMHKFCFTLDQVADDIVGGITDKNPKCRSAVLRFVAASVPGETAKESAKAHGALLGPLAKAATDATPDVRDSAFGALAAFATKAGSMGPLNKVVNAALDEKQQKKLTDLVMSGGAGAPGGAKAAPSVRASTSRPATASGKRPVTAPPLTSRDTNAPKAAAAAPARKKAPAAAAAAATARDDDDVALNQAPAISDDDALERLDAMAGAGTVANLRSSDWKLRLEGMEAVAEAVNSQKENMDAEAVVQAISAVPGFGEKNVRVMGKCLEVLALIAGGSDGFGKREAFGAIKGSIEKVADAKLKDTTSSLLTACAEACGVQFVLTQVHKQASSHRNPKVLAESVAWMGGAMRDFGLQSVRVGDVIGWMKEYLGGTNAGAKASAVKALGVMHATLGPQVKNYLGDVKPAILSQIEAEFASPAEPHAAPTRTVRSAAPKKRAPAAAAAPGAPYEEEEEEEPVAVNMDDLLPREDISAKITAKLVKDLGSSAWKERQAAIQEVDQILAGANHRILPSTGDLVPALKGRLADTNKNLVAAALRTFGAIAQAMGPAFKHDASRVMSDCVKNYSDSKPNVRAAVSVALDAVAGVLPLKHVLPYVSEYVPNAKASLDGKKDALSWLTAHLQAGEAGEGDLPEVLKIASAGLGDKAVDVRAVAQAALVELVNACGPGAVSDAAGHLSSKQQDLLLPALEKAGGGGGGGGMTARPGTAGARPGTARPATAPAPAARPGTSSGSRTARAAPARASAAAAPKAVKARDVPMSMRASVAATAGALDGGADGTLLLMNDHKEERIPSGPLGRAKGKFEEPRQEHVDELQAQFEPFLRADMSQALFSKDFKKHCSALDALTRELPNIHEEVVGNLDLLLRWAVFRVCDTNTTALVKTLEFLNVLLAQLEAEGYTMTDWEANSLVPAVVEKCGHNQDRIRQSFRDILRRLCGVYSPTKVFNLVLDGTKVKNNRTRIECLDEMSALLGRFGMGICAHPNKVLPGVAKIVAERDNALRASALNTLAVVYKMQGDEIWRLMGDLQPAQKGLLDDKFRYTAKQMAKGGEGAPGTYRPVTAPAAAAAAAPRPSPARAAPERASMQAPMVQAAAEPAAVAPASVSASVAVASPAQEAVRTHDIHRQMTPPNGLPRQFSDSPSHSKGAASSSGSGDRLSLGGARSDEDVAEDWRKALLSVSSISDAESVEGMKLVCHEMMAASSGQHSASVLALFASQVDGLVGVLSRKVESFFDDATASGPGAPTRPCKYVLNTLMQTFQQPRLAQAVSEGVLRDLIGLLLMRLLDERVPQLEEGPQLLKALNVLMLKILENSSRTSCFSLLLLLLRVPPPRVEGGDPALKAKFCDLIVKCLIKLTKALSTSLPDVDVDTLLLSVHGFFMGLGVDEIRRRGAEDDKPLRMVKTVLHELTKLKGPAIRGHLTKVPRTEPPPIIHAYIDLNLQTLQTAGILPADGGAGGAGAGGDVAGGGSGGAPGTPSSMPPPDLKAQLATVFKKIGDKATTAQGLEELYHFTKANPSIDITPHLSKTSDAFRLYIQRGLAKVEAAERVKAGGGVPSPSGSMPPTPDTAGRYTGASPGSRAATTNLDELRERMRSIQATVGSSVAASPGGPGIGLAGGVGVAASPQPKAPMAGTASLSALQERMNRLRSQAAE